MTMVAAGSITVAGALLKYLVFHFRENTYCCHFADRLVQFVFVRQQHGKPPASHNCHSIHVFVEMARFRLQDASQTHPPSETLSKLSTIVF